MNGTNNINHEGNNANGEIVSMNSSRSRSSSSSSGHHHGSPEELLQDLWMKFHVTLEEANHRLLSSSSSSSSNNADTTNNDSKNKKMMMEGEELWQGCNVVEDLFGMLGRMWDVMPVEQSTPQEYIEMVHHCHCKLSTFLQQILMDTIFQNDWDDGTQEGQSTVARFLQHYLRHHTTTTTTTSTTTVTTDNNNNNNNPNNNKNDDKTTTLQNTILMATKEYQAYQRRIFRQRCKPCIASVAQIRNMVTTTTNNTTMGEWLYEQNQLYDTHHQHNDDDEEEDEDAHRYRTQPHAHAIMIILAEASNLIHPLSLWYSGLQQQQQQQQHNDNKKSDLDKMVQQMCLSTIHSLQEEVQNLATRVGDWFLQDYHIRSSSSSSSNKTQQQSSSKKEERNTNHNHNLAIMDKTLEEMSFLCQVVSRYNIFIQHTLKDHHPNNNDNNDIPIKDCRRPSLKEFSQELGLHYSLMETKFSQENWYRAQSMAYPTKFMTDEEIYIPSLVEDAIYLCQRALERANSTFSEHAMWTVSNWVVELWTLTNDETTMALTTPNTTTTTTNNSSTQQQQKQQKEHKPRFYNNVYTALLHQIGCVVVEPNQQQQQQLTNENNEYPQKKDEPPVSGNSFMTARFATALLQALDQSSTTTSDNTTAPSSGNTMMMMMKKKNNHQNKRADAIQIKLDTELCTMNGMHAASTACLSLANLLDSLLLDDDEDEDEDRVSTKQKSSSSSSSSSSVSMVQLAKEQMESKSKEFHELLKQHIYTNVIPAWCGNTPKDLSIRPPLAALATMEMAPCFLHLFYYLTAHQDYNIMDAPTFHQREGNGQDCAIFHTIFSSPSSCQLLEQRFKCQDEVLLVLLSEMARHVSHILLGTIIAQKKHFTTWGSFILSKQVRTLEDMFCNTLVIRSSNSDSIAVVDEKSTIGTTMMNTAIIWNQFQKLTQAVTILQLERPSDWLSFASTTDDDHLSMEEKRDIMRLRKDFSEDAINAVCGNGKNNN